MLAVVDKIYPHCTPELYYNRIMLPPPVPYSLHLLAQRKKREYWDQFLEELGAEDPWKVVRIAKDPFRLQPSMGDIFEGNRRLWTKEKVYTAINDSNFVTEQINEVQPATVQQPREYTEMVLLEMAERVEDVLASTSNISALGPDGINYRLLKTISNTHLGK